MLNRFASQSYSQKKNRYIIHWLFGLTASLLLLPWPAGAALEAAICTTALSLQQPTQAQSGAQITPQGAIELNKPIEKELAGDQEHSYQISLTAGQYLNAVVEQRGIDVMVMLIGPDGKELVRMDSHDGPQGAEQILWTAEVTGDYRLNICALEKNARAGRYEVKIKELRKTTEEERDLTQVTLLTTNSLPNLAELYTSKGDLAKFEGNWRSTIAFLEKMFGLEHPYTTAQMMRLAEFYRYTVGYEKAESLLRRSLEIREKAYGLRHSETAFPLDRLGGLYRDKGDYEQAEPLLRRAFEIRERVFGAEHLYTAFSLNALAELYHAKGDLSHAERMFRRALEIKEKALGLEHQETTRSIHCLATLYLDKGDYEQAETLFRRVLTNREKTLATEHPDTVSAENSLALLYCYKGDYAQAVQLASLASAAREKHVAAILLTGSEYQKRLYLDKLSEETNFAISLHVRSAPADSQAGRLALTVILQRKGRALDAMSDQLSALRRHISPQNRELFDELASVRTQLATLQFGSTGAKLAPEALRSRIDSLKTRERELEDKISRRSVEFHAQSQPITLETMQAAISAGTALVEFAVYRPVDVKTPKGGPAQYVAYALTSQGEPRYVELGETATIDKAVEDLREALSCPQKRDCTIVLDEVIKRARKLDGLVMQPVRKLLGDTKHILISPDGALNLIPFAALVDEQGEYLIKRYAITYLTSGRDLLRLQIARESKSVPLVVADPIFGEPATKKQAMAQAAATAKSREQTINNNSDLDVHLRPFNKVAGAEDEARRLKRILPEATVLTQHEATETSLKQTNAPHILHISTHGFFLDDLAMTPENERRSRSLRSGSVMASEAVSAGRTALLENPLLVSGLALAGANQRKSGDDDGILTALEVAGLDLWGTKLVTLSACDTGVGRVKNGEGVYGLRRALVLAGSESQVMSLWKVDGLATRDLMTDYYKKLIQKGGRGEALRQAQLEMLKNPKRRHPFYWASFIQSGEWANLDGKR
ncbi:MAG: CHAT domain-containing protein [Blastocatellia bacterium]